MSQCLPILALLLVLGAMIVALKLFERRLSPELSRKLLHVGMGLTVLSLPWVFDRAWPVLVVCGLAAIALAIVKFVPRLRDSIGTVVNKVDRPTLGEVCFPVSVGLIFLVSRGDKLLFIIPMLIMTLADAMAALIGITYGKVRYVTSEGLKSAEGSITFFSIAFLSVHVPLLLCTNVGRAETLLIAATIGLLVMLLEAMSWRGLDNLLIPLGTFAFLKLYMHASSDALLLRLCASIVLLIFALAWRRRSSLDDSALMSVAMYGFGAAVIGGPVWLIAPLLLFIAHVILWPRHTDRRPHTVYAVFGAVGSGLFWLGAFSIYGSIGNPHLLYPYAVAFGTELCVIGISHITTEPSGHRADVRLASCFAASLLITLAQMLPLLFLHASRITPLQFLALAAIAVPCIALGLGIFWSSVKLLHRGPDALVTTATARFATSLLASGIAAGALALLSSY